MIEEHIVKVPSDAGSLAIQYLAAGTGSPVLLLHGVGDSARSWQQVMLPLARGYRVFAPSLPGYGTSTIPKADYSPVFFRQVVSAFLDALQIERVAVIGNSLGGLIGIRLALAEPWRVSALGLVDSAGLGRKVALPLRMLSIPGMGRVLQAVNSRPYGAWQWAFSMALMLTAQPLRTPMDWIGEQYRMARRPGYLMATAQTVRTSTTLRGVRPEEIVLDLLPQLQLPTLIVWGERDKLVPLAHAHAAAARLPQARLVIIPNCGHAPQLDHPRVFCAVVESFLNDQRHDGQIERMLGGII